MSYTNNIHAREKNRIANKLKQITLPSGARMTIMDEGGYALQISLHGGPYGFPKYTFDALNPAEGLKASVTGYDSSAVQPEAMPEDYHTIMDVIGHMKPQIERNGSSSPRSDGLSRRSWGSLGSFFGMSGRSSPSRSGNSSPRSFSGGRRRKTRTKRRYRRLTRKVRS